MAAALIIRVDAVDVISTDPVTFGPDKMARDFEIWLIVLAISS